MNYPLMLYKGVKGFKGFQGVELGKILKQEFPTPLGMWWNFPVLPSGKSWIDLFCWALF